VLIADDHTVVAEGLAVALSAHFTIVGQVTVLDDLLGAILGSEPDVVVLDLSFGGVSSLPTMQEAIADRRIRSRFVILTAHESRALAAAAQKAGALAFLLKGASTSDLRLAIEAAHRGERYSVDAPPEERARQADVRPGELVTVAGLDFTTRQVQILDLLAQGFDREDIADVVGLTVKGVDYHFHELRELVGTSNTRLLAIWAVEHLDALALALEGKGDSARLLARPRRRS
jgi:DNA-binding NarL/FixJ family response regulator